MKNTRDQPLRWSCKVKSIVCTHLEVEVEKAQLEVELVTPKWYDYGGFGCYALVVSI